MFYSNKRVLVTGGTGFVGTHFVEKLLSLNALVRVAVHNRPPIITDPKIEYITADLTNPEDCRRVSHGIQYIFHCAGAVSAAAVTVSNPMGAIATNLILTVQMLQAAWDERVERFLVFSSSTGYPESGVPLKEEDMWSGPTHPVYFGYGWMRRYLERLSEFIAERSDLKIALARPTAVYGRWDNFDSVTAHVIPALIRRAVEKQDPYVVWGDGNEVRDFLHITDLVQGCLLLLEKYPVCEPVNIGYGSAVTIREIISIILHASEFPNAEVIYDNSKPSTIPFRIIDIEKAERILGFRPHITLDEGITDTVLWYRKNQTKG